MKIKKPDCKNWQDIGSDRCGDCSIGVYQRPSHGVCWFQCEKREALTNEPTPEIIQDEPPKDQSTIVQAFRRASDGAVGLAKVLFGVGLASDDVVKARLEICEACEDAVPCVHNSETKCCGPLTSIFGGGENCGCIITKKTKIKTGKCPKDKWGPCDEQSGKELA